MIALSPDLLLVILVVDFPDERLKDVLQRDDARRPAVLVDHHHHVRALPPHLLEGVHRRHAFRDEVNLNARN